MIECPRRGGEGGCRETARGEGEPGRRGSLSKSPEAYESMISWGRQGVAMGSGTDRVRNTSSGQTQKGVCKAQAKGSSPCCGNRKGPDTD